MIAGAGAVKLLSLPITLGFALLNTWMILRYATPATYGYIALASTLFQLIPFVDLGLGAPISNAASHATPFERTKQQQPEQRVFEDVLARAMRLLLRSSSAIALVSLTFWTADVWPRLLAFPDDLSSQGNNAVLAAMTIFALSVPLSVGHRIMVGFGKINLYTLFTIVGAAVSTASIVVLIALDTPPLYLAVGAPLGMLATSFISYGYASGGFARGTHMLTKAARSVFTAANNKDLWRAAGPMMIIVTTVPIAMYSDRVILAHVSSASELSRYALAAQLYGPVYALLATAGIALWPVFAQSKKNTWPRWVSATRAFSGVGVIGGIGFATTSPFVAKIVSGGSVTLPLSLVWAFAALILVMSLHQASAYLLTSAEDLRFQAWCTSSMLALNLPASALLGLHWGAAGPVWASAFAVTIAQIFPEALRVTRRFRQTEDAK